MNWQQRTQVVLTEAQWSEVKCALWDSWNKFKKMENDSRCDSIYELRNLINSQTRASKENV